MSQNNRAYRNLVFFVSIFCLVSLCFACDKKRDKSEDLSKSGEFANKMLANLAKPDQEIIALLAAKYNKDLDLIESIVDIYLTDTDLAYRQIKSAIKEKTKGETKQPNEINLDLFALNF